MTFLAKLSLRMKIVGLAIGILVVAAMGSAYNLSNIKKAFENGENSSFTLFAQSLSEALAAQMFERYGDAQAFAVNGAVKSLKPEGMSAYLDQYVSLYGIYDLIMVVNKNGQMVSASTKDPSGKSVNYESLKFTDFSKEPWFRAVMSGKTTDDKEKALAGTYIEDFIKDPVLEKAFGESRFATSFSAAIKDDSGEIIGVVTNRTGSRWFEGEVLNAWNGMKKFGLESPTITILNGNGLIIVDHRPMEVSNSKNEIVHNAEVLLKMDMAKHPAVELLKTQDYGSIHAINSKTNIDEVVGYAKIPSVKWPSQVNWNILIRDSVESVSATSQKAAFDSIVVLGINIFIALALAAWVGVLISKSIDNQIKILSNNSAEVSGASRSIASQSTQLSESATEQAAALQETMAAVDEINAMVEKNSESAQKSKEVSNQSREAAQRGRSTVDSMINSMSEISSANNQIKDQMTSSNRQLSEITQLINDIGTKTKVINEIVLQTKLLSFNASVEAARAGESGKGFAVVAEEVGNLAQMSGNAAKEITDLLDKSVRKVNAIVEDTKAKVDRLMMDAEQKVNAGSATAEQCNSVLEEIISQVSNVDVLVSEIAVASKEQSQGIREISKAVSQMEEVTNQNSSVAQASSVSAEQLSSQAQELDAVVQSLVAQVRGAGASTVYPTETKQGRHLPADGSKKSHGKESKTHGKVISMKKHEVSSSTNQAPVQVASVTKAASGSEYVPGSNDPGFQE